MSTGEHRLLRRFVLYTLALDQRVVTTEAARRSASRRETHRDRTVDVFVRRPRKSTRCSKHLHPRASRQLQAELTK
jgi:DNA-binding response OmpR family regulator